MVEKILIEGKKLPIFCLEDELDGKTVDEVINYFIELGTQVGGDEQIFKMEYLYGESRLNLISYRYETDKEYEKRLLRLEKAKERKKQEKIKKEEKERKELERLKAKYGA